MPSSRSSTRVSTWPAQSRQRLNFALCADAVLPYPQDILGVNACLRALSCLSHTLAAMRRVGVLGAGVSVHHRCGENCARCVLLLHVCCAIVTCARCTDTVPLLLVGTKGNKTRQRTPLVCWQFLLQCPSCSPLTMCPCVCVRVRVCSFSVSRWAFPWCWATCSSCNGRPTCTAAVCPACPLSSPLLALLAPRGSHLRRLVVLMRCHSLRLDQIFNAITIVSSLSPFSL